MYIKSSWLPSFSIFKTKKFHLYRQVVANAREREKAKQYAQA